MLKMFLVLSTHILPFHKKNLAVLDISRFSTWEIYMAANQTISKEIFAISIQRHVALAGLGTQTYI